MPPARIKAERLWRLSLTSQWQQPFAIRHGSPPACCTAATITRRLSRLADIAERTLVPLIATNDVLYHAPQRRALQDVMTCIREHVTIDTRGYSCSKQMPSDISNRHGRWRACFDAYRRRSTAHCAFIDRCNFSLQRTGGHRISGREPSRAMRLRRKRSPRLSEKGAEDAIPMAFRTRCAKRSIMNSTSPAGLQLREIFSHRLRHRHITRAQRTFCAKGAARRRTRSICYCLRITEVDPAKVELLFERFVSRERKEPPDIDVDFEHERREEVIQHIYKKYGRDHAGLTATVICYRGRSAIREVGKAFGLSDDTIGALAGTLWGWSTVRREGTRKPARLASIRSDPRLNQVMALAEELIGTPRHLSQHPGGFLITRSRIDEVVPVENAAMDDRTCHRVGEERSRSATPVEGRRARRSACSRACGAASISCSIHYQKPETIGRLLQEGYDEQQRRSRNWRHVPVYDMISARRHARRRSRSKAARKCRCCRGFVLRRFYDLVIEVAIVRPGPIQGKMVHPYLTSRERSEITKMEPNYPSPAPSTGREDELREILKETMGVPLFQEQAMRIAMVAAKFSDVEANGLRRAMATFKRVGTIENFEKMFIERMTARGYESQFRQTLLRPNPRLRRIRLSGKPRGEFRQPRLRLVLDEVLLPGRLRRRAAQQPADGLLRALADRARRARARRRGAAGRRERVGLGLRAGAAHPSPGRAAHDACRRGRLHMPRAGPPPPLRSTHSPPPCRDERPHPHRRTRCASASGRVSGFSEADATTIESVRGRGLRLGARLLAAHAAAALDAGAARTMPMRSVRSGFRGAMRCGRCARCGAPATRTTCRCSRASRCRAGSRTSRCRRCLRASRWWRTIATCTSR